MNYENEELKLVDIQMIFSGLIILTVLLSLTVTYNNHLILSGKQPFLTEEEAKNINVVAKILALISALAFLFINVMNAELLKEEGKNPKNSYIESGASFFIVIATIIVLYISLKNGSDLLIASENPEI